MQLVGNISTIYSLASIASEYVPGAGIGSRFCLSDPGTDLEVIPMFNRCQRWFTQNISFFSTFVNKVAVVEKDLPVSSGKPRTDLKD